VYLGALFVMPAYELWQRRRPHAVSLIGAIALTAIELSTDYWLAVIGS
jgi:hypothetical protein